MIFKSGLGALGCAGCNGKCKSNGLGDAVSDWMASPSYINAMRAIATAATNGTPVVNAIYTDSGQVITTSPTGVQTTTDISCPTGFEWDGLAGLSGCRPNASTLATQLAAQQANALALQKQKAASECPAGYEWDGILDSITTGLSGCRPKVVAPITPVATTSSIQGFLTNTIAGVPVWAGLTGLVAVLVLASGR